MAASAPQGMRMDQSSEMQDGEDAGGETTLFPKSMLGGKECKAGDELRFRVVREHEQEVEVEFEGYGSKDNEDTEDVSPESGSGDTPEQSYYD